MNVLKKALLKLDSFFKEPSDAENEDRTFWLKPLSVFFLYFFLCIVACWNWSSRTLPPPGFAVAALGVAAALMAVLGEMKKKAKMAWIFLLFSFLWIELESIKKERFVNEEYQKSFRAEQLKHFKDIADDITTSISLQQSLLRANQELAILVQPLTMKEAFKKKALTLSTTILQALLVNQAPQSSQNAVTLGMQRLQASDQLSRIGYPAKIRQVCEEFKTYGLSCTKPKSDDPVTRFQTQAQEVTDLALKL